MNSSTSNRLAILDLARGIALLIVVLSHFCAWLTAEATEESVRAFSHYIADRGYYGTNTFLVLSAFLLSRSLLSGQSWTTAVGRRMARLYPPFLVVLALYTLAAPFYPGQQRIPSDPVEAFLYLLANAFLLPGILPIAPLVTVTWSLSLVVFGYLGLVAITQTFSLPKWSPAPRAALWLALACAAYPLDGTLARIWYLPLGAFLADLNGLLDNPCGKVFRQSNALTGAWATVSKLAYAVFLTHGFVLHAGQQFSVDINSPWEFATVLGLLLTASGMLAYGAQTWVFDPLVGRIMQAAPRPIPQRAVVVRD